MTGTNDKVRALILTALMVFSVIGGSIAFAGSAAADANNISMDTSTENAGATGVDYTVSGDVTSSFTLQYVDIDASAQYLNPEGNSSAPSPDFSATTESDITVIVDGEEYQDGFTEIVRDGNGEFQFKLSNSVTVDSNVTVILGDVKNPSPSSDFDDGTGSTGTADDDKVTYHFQAQLEDSGNNVEETFGGDAADTEAASYDINVAGGSTSPGGDTDPSYEGPGEENRDYDATYQTGANRWTGQILYAENLTNVDAGGDDIVELHKVEDISGATDAVGDLVTEIGYESSSNNGEALIQTSSLSGQYVLTDGDGNVLRATNPNGNLTVSPNDENSLAGNDIITIVNQDFSASFDDNTVTEDGDIDVEFDSNRASYTVTVSSDDLSDSVLNDTFGDTDTTLDGVQVDVSGNSVSQTYTLDGVNAGNYTIDFDVTDTDNSDSDFLDVSEPGAKAASFDQAVVSEERGDVVEFTVNLEGGVEEATVELGSDDVNYRTTMTITDGDDDGQVTVQWNTWEAGYQTDENVAFSAAGDDDSVSQVQRFTNRIPEDSRVSAADYDLAVSVDGDEEDVGVISLNARSTDSAAQWVIPGGSDPANATELLEDVTATQTVALGDKTVTQVTASGIFGYIGGLDDLQTVGDDGVRVTIVQTGETTNQNAKQIKLNQSSGAVQLFVDADNNQHYIVVDTEEVTASRQVQKEGTLSLEDGETYNVTFLIDGDESPYVEEDETEEVSTQFTVEDPTAEFDTTDDNVTVDAAAEQQITGTSNLAPGTSVTVRVKSTGASPFLKSNTTTIGPNGTFTSTFDFSNVSQGTEFTARITSPSSINDVSSPGIVAPAPTATVTINNQTSDGTTATVASATLSDGGFITIHDGTLLDGAVFDSVRGTSAYLEAGSHSDITVSLDSPYTESGTAIAMPHLDTNGNEVYDFVTSEGAEDGPYTNDAGDIVLDPASLTVSTPTPTPSPTATPEPDTPTPEPDTPTPEPDTPTPEPDTPTPSPTPGDGPGFGLVAALIALAGAALIALRRD